jgi:hypothetical protein
LGAVPPRAVALIKAKPIKNGVIIIFIGFLL